MLPLLDVNMALAKGDFNLLRNLVASGTDVNIQDKEGRTALINCCLHDGENWALGSARLLLTYGAKVGLCDKVGRNALMYAIMYGRKDLVKLFLDALDYDLVHTDKWHHTALWYATHCGNTNITTMVKEVSKKYCSDAEESGKNLNLNTPIQYRTSQQQQQHKPNTSDYTKNRFNKKHSTPNINRTPYLLPFKPLPANLWEKRVKFYSNKENLSRNSVQRPINYLPALQRTTKLSTIPKKEGIQECSPHYTWREDIKGLTAILEIQLTSSYHTKARLLPPSIKRYPKIPKDEIEGNLKNEAQGKRKGKNRRLSFDGLDVLQNRLSAKGLFRRRCSVAVIPLIRFKNYKSSFSVEQEYQKFKSSFA